ncbi:helix-turn-helix transcriptional regulator [Streptomyces sp. NPDC096080]|uniref:helix-turn-helix domain-containing protein n=1 Tax=Streptomyces sp. NPDC096080 TaxID=3156693 RepID=UPI0033167304
MSVRSNGPEIRRRRLLRGVSLTEFARQMNYSLNHASQVELGNNNAGPEFVSKAAALLGCTTEDLMTEDAEAGAA